MKITVAQLNPLVGHLEGNLQRLEETSREAHRSGAALAVFPELFLAGYPPKDLLDFEWFLTKVEETIAKVVEFSKEVPGIGILFGAPRRGHGSGSGKGEALAGPAGRETRAADSVCGENGLYNAAILVCGGDLLLEQHKSLLPTYDVFDEARYFDPAHGVSVLPFGGELLGVSICEDAWFGSEIGQVKRRYARDPVAELARQGATLMVNISASPFNAGKEELRFSLVSAHARRHKVPFLYVNQVGANDELIFDGRSFLVDGRGRPAAVFPCFRETVRTVDTTAAGSDRPYEPQEQIESVHDALVLGVRDYMRKCGFKKAVLGLSGGIDSAVTACIAERAVGGGNVLGITMPAPFSSRGSVEDSRRLAENLGIPFETVPITGIYESYLRTLDEHFEGLPRDVTEENVQARIRGNILMAFSNKHGSLLLSTGNKSELSTGYCTLYGDMSGGLAVIADVPKTMVYELAAHINRDREIIPRAIIEKAPSAELRPNQTDQDTLPPYPVLDDILALHIEGGLSADEIIGLGRKRGSGSELDPDTVRWVVRTVAKNEYKRKQAAPCLRVTTKAFGIGRRMPLASRYWD
jgi:NAD+ synthase (glutamine-hydrolysing)